MVVLSVSINISLPDTLHIKPEIYYAPRSIPIIYLHIKLIAHC